MTTPAELLTKSNAMRAAALRNRVAKLVPFRKDALDVATPPAAASTVFQGIPITIDRPRGYRQTGVDDKGQQWERVYHTDYGFIPNTKGGDGEGIDVFLGADDRSPCAFWVLQQKPDPLGNMVFDEYKLMLGFKDADTAKGMYLAHVPKKYFGAMAETSTAMVNALLGVQEPVEMMKALAGFTTDRNLLVQNEPGSPEALSRLWVISDKAKALVDQVSKRFQEVADDPEAPMPLAKGTGPAGELRYALGVVLEPDIVDAQGDTYDAETIRMAAWEYLDRFRNLGHMHKGLINGKARLVESYVAQCDMDIEGMKVRKGTWMMGVHVVDEGLWKRVRTGDLGGLSIGGFAKKQPISASFPRP